MVHKSKMKVTKGQIQKALQLVNPKYKLASFKEIDHGIINLIYFLKNQHNEEYVLRICNPLWESFKVNKELAVQEIIQKNTSIPLPEVVAYETSKKTMPYTFTITKKLPGENLEKSFDKLKEKDQVKIFEKLGDYLAQIHSITFDLFGGFAKKGEHIVIVPVGDLVCTCPASVGRPGPYKTWPDMYSNYIAMHMNGLKKTRFKRYIPKFRKFFASHEMPDVPARLCHGDFSLCNILAHNTKIMAVLDWEWATTGDSEEEYFGFENEYKEKYPKAFAAFKKRYKIPLSRAYSRKKKVYEISSIVNYMISFEWSYMKSPPEEKEKKYKELCKKADDFLK